MDRNNFSGLNPVWLISLAMVLGTTIVVLLPASIAGGDAIKTSDWIGFAGNVVAGAMTIVAALVAWVAVQKQIGAQHKIAESQIAAQRVAIPGPFSDLAKRLSACVESEIRGDGSGIYTSSLFVDANRNYGELRHGHKRIRQSYREFGPGSRGIQHSRNQTVVAPRGNAGA